MLSTHGVAITAQIRTNGQVSNYTKLAMRTRRFIHSVTVSRSWKTEAFIFTTYHDNLLTRRGASRDPTVTYYHVGASWDTVR